jgi:hypothetical protein
MLSVSAAKGLYFEAYHDFLQEKQSIRAVAGIRTTGKSSCVVSGASVDAPGEKVENDHRANHVVNMDTLAFQLSPFSPIRCSVPTHGGKDKTTSATTCKIAL